jgi:hypothetical protein
LVAPAPARNEALSGARSSEAHAWRGSTPVRLEPRATGRWVQHPRSVCDESGGGLEALYRLELFLNGGV